MVLSELFHCKQQPADAPNEPDEFQVCRYVNRNNGPKEVKMLYMDE